MNPTFETYFSTLRYRQTLQFIHLVLFLASFSTPYKPNNISDRSSIFTYFERFLHCHKTI